jgi:DNA-binding transcriptional LysR family regulator
MDNSKTSFVLDVDLLTLRSFLAIIDLGSFSAAAQQIGRSQSAVSLQIARLEDRMQVSLLERTSRSVKLTPEGETFASYARKIIDLSDEGFAAVSTMDTTEPLRLGFAEYLVPRHLKEVLTGLRKSLPKTKISLTLGGGGDLYEDLNRNELDIVIAGPVGDYGLPLYSEPLVWAQAKSYTRDNPDILEIIQMKGPCSYRKAAIDALQTSGIRWHEEASVNTIQGVIAAVSAGFGISSMPKSSVDDSLQIIEGLLPELPQTSINMYWNTTNPHPLTKRCIAIFEEEIRLIGMR